MLYLKAATSATVMMGPYVGSDGVGLTGLTVTQSSVMLSKNGAAFTAKNETSNGSHRILGYYSAMFNNTDLDTVGRLLLVSSCAAALPVRHEFTILPTSVYNSLIDGTDLLMIDIEQWKGTSPNALTSGRVDVSAGAMADSVITSASLALGGVERMANMLTVDMSSLSVAVAARSPVNALRPLRNKLTTSGFITVFAENDTTAVWTSVITVDPTAAPIVGSDPA